VKDRRGRGRRLLQHHGRPQREEKDQHIAEDHGGGWGRKRGMVTRCGKGERGSPMRKDVPNDKNSKI